MNGKSRDAFAHQVINRVRHTTLGVVLDHLRRPRVWELASTQHGGRVALYDATFARKDTLIWITLRESPTPPQATHGKWTRAPWKRS